MGDLLAVECSNCSYSTELYDGVGMAGIVNEILECGPCRQIVGVAVLSEPSSPSPFGEIHFGHCPKCDGEEFHEVRWSRERDSLFLECPKCREPALVTNVGIWD